MDAHTLSVHKVRDGNGVDALRVGERALEDSIGMALLRPDAHVLLAEVLHLSLERDRLLHTTSISKQLSQTFQNG